MKNNQDALQQALKSIIAETNFTTTPESVGTVMQYGDGVLEIKGLEDVQAGELIDLGGNLLGLALKKEHYWRGRFR